MTKISGRQFMKNKMIEPVDEKDKMVYYGNYGAVDFCDLCGNPTAVTHAYENENYLTYTGKQFLCKKCLKG